MKKTPFLRTAYNYDTNAAGDESALECKDPTLAQQHFKDECDINTIVDRFALTGELPQNVRMPTHGDFTNVVSFQEAMNALVSARESFDKMPAKVRARFHNDPQEFVEFCSNDDNRPEAIKLGLVPPPPVVKPQDGPLEQTSTAKTGETTSPETPTKSDPKK